MNRTLTIIGLTITFLYLVVFYYGIEGRLSQIRTMELNNLGDFFAGAFGPLAILWLILGYFQQGKELKQNTEALKLQAEELKNSVKQQEKLVNTTQLQLKHQVNTDKARQHEIEERLKPKFIIKKIISHSEGIESIHNKDMYIVEVVFQNIGYAAENVDFTVEDKRLDESFGWHHHGCSTGDSIEFSFRIKYDSKNRHEDMKVLMLCTYDYQESKKSFIKVELDITNIGYESGVIATIL